MQRPLLDALGNLAQWPRFFVWRLTDWNGKKFDTKHPWNGYHQFDARAACLAGQLFPLQQALQQLQQFINTAGPDERFALGWYVMPDAGYWFLDIDAAVTWGDDGNPVFDATARQAWDHLAPHGVFCEYSSSLQGLHFVGRGVLPPHMTTGSRIPAPIELYSGNRGICFGMSGYAIMGSADAHAMPPAEWIVSPLQDTTGVLETGQRMPQWDGPEDDDELIRRMLSRRDGVARLMGNITLQDLWEGNDDAICKRWPHETTAKNRTRCTEADGALASHLAWWTGCDIPRMTRLMWRSNLVREKWSDPHHANYLPTTMREAAKQLLARQDATCYSQPKPKLPPLLPALPELVVNRAEAPAEPHRGTPAAFEVITRAGNADELKDAAKRIAAMGPWDAADLETISQRMKRKSQELGSTWPLPLCRRMVDGTSVDAMDSIGAPEWLDDWAFISTQNKYCHISADFDCITREALHTTLFAKPEIPIKQNGDKEDAGKMLNLWGVSVVSDLGYNPRAELIYPEGRRMLLNKFHNSMPDSQEGGDPAAIAIYQQHLWNIADGNQQNYSYLLRWMAHVVQRPGDLIRWAVLLIGKHGTGKTAMAAPLMAAIGKRNVKLGSSKGVNNGGGFMDWVANEQMLGVISDFGVEGVEKFATADALKPVISDNLVSITRKGKVDVTYSNYASYIFSSNKREPVPMAPTERRYFVLTTTWLDTLISDRPNEAAEYMATLSAAIDKLTPGQWRAWFESIEVGDLPAVAPKTDAFMAIVGNSVSEPMQALRELVNGHDVVTTNKMTDALRGIEGAPTRKALTKAMNELGFDYYPEQRLTLRGTKVGIYVRSAKISVNSVDWQTLKAAAEEFNRVQDLALFDPARGGS